MYHLLLSMDQKSRYGSAGSSAQGLTRLRSKRHWGYSLDLRFKIFQDDCCWQHWISCACVWSRIFSMIIGQKLPLLSRSCSQFLPTWLPPWALHNGEFASLRLVRGSFSCSHIFFCRKGPAPLKDSPDWIKSTQDNLFWLNFNWFWILKTISSLSCNVS